MILRILGTNIKNDIIKILSQSKNSLNAKRQEEI